MSQSESTITVPAAVLTELMEAGNELAELVDAQRADAQPSDHPALRALTRWESAMFAAGRAV